MNTYNLVAISGSLRKASFNSDIVRAFKAQAPEGVSIEVLDISTFPLFNQDLEAEFPQVVTDVKNKIRNADGVIIITPEYNRSIPGPLKNAIDWIGRPYGDSAWNQKPVFVGSASIGGIGGALANYSLRESLAFLNAFVPGQPEFFVGTASSKVDEAGTLTDEETKKRIDEALVAFTAYIEKLR